MHTTTDMLQDLPQGLRTLLDGADAADGPSRRSFLKLATASGFALGGRRVQATVMFSDIRGFTSMVESQSPEDTIELLNTYYTLMFDAITSSGGVVNQMVGDGLMSIFGAPLPLADPCGSAVHAAREMMELIALLNVEREAGSKAEQKLFHGGSPDADVAC